ncbi:hypothetical protein PCANC_13447 [Puccinia coronata f. sp. avenae]|uniref:Uncharacterized protein n=1 Tax=Puccinia coronata f. sp. avenae TaxID=200324 RepID=A0A2N5SRD9_9BASI|nr:hypothetical protein PCANC_13447 [Puccinia coronata f. sp. avenae]
MNPELAALDCSLEGDDWPEPVPSNFQPVPPIPYVNPHLLGFTHQSQFLHNHSLILFNPSFPASHLAQWRLTSFFYCASKLSTPLGSRNGLSQILGILL